MEYYIPHYVDCPLITYAAALYAETLDGTEAPDVVWADGDIAEDFMMMKCRGLQP